MSWTELPPGEGDEAGGNPGFPEHLRHLLASALGYVSARLELAGLEGREALVAYGKVIALLVLALVLVAFGYIFFLFGVVALVTWFSGWHWGWVVLSVGLLHFLGALAAVLIARAGWGRPLFPATFEEFRKDQQWLSRRSKRESHN